MKNAGPNWEPAQGLYDSTLELIRFGSLRLLPLLHELRNVVAKHCPSTLLFELLLDAEVDVRLVNLILLVTWHRQGLK